MLLFAAALLLLNDHFLKGAGLLPGVVTGKLSDVCGLVALSVVAGRLARVVISRDSRRLDAAVCAVAAILFALVKTTAPFNALYGAILGPTRIDPTDLLALPAALAAYALLRAPAPPSPWRDRAGLVLAAVGCMATSPQPRPRPPAPPAMTLAQAPACAVVVASGIEPRGGPAVVHFTTKNSGATDCDVTVRVQLEAKTQTPGVELSVSGSKGPVTLAAGSTADVQIVVSGPYAISCDAEAHASWEIVESGAQGTSKNAGGGRIGCWHSVALSP